MEIRTKMIGIQLLLMLILFTAATITSAAVVTVATNTTSPHCPAECGNVTIPYPFGIGDGCFKPGFEINCTKNITGKDDTIVYTPVIGRNIEVINISLLGQASVYKHISFACYDKYGNFLPDNSFASSITLIEPYTLSDTRNKFTAIGCDTLAYIKGPVGQGYTSGCVSICQNQSNVPQDGSCSGMGCCQTSIPKGLQYYNASFDAGFNHSSVWNFNPCSFSFLADQDWYRFNSSDVNGTGFYYRNNGHVPIVLDWTIGNKSCQQAQLNKVAYSCLSENSYCIDSTNGPGYNCNCSTGYQGNPYLPNGCQDINECNFPVEYPCYGGICSNSAGSYSCKRNSTKFPLWVKLIIGAISSMLFVVIIGFWIYLGLEKGKLIRAKLKFYEQNGGFLLKEKIGSSHISASFKIFTKEELEKATNKFDTDNILGYGGQGTVYKGALEDKRIVAIKKARVFNERQNREFAKEMLILSEINHINIVKLLGCCLEVEIPMLVYEFISNGTLFQYIHDKSPIFPVRLDTRLRIAAESAEALSYLHSAASAPIIHGDVKSANILLDVKYTAKVSDFGASKLAPMDENQFATLVQNLQFDTCGYLDPEYLQTCQLTQKSDVYSFGVVLLEILTGKKAIYFEGSDEERSLASSFISALKQDRLLEILDDQVKTEGSAELFQEIGELVRQCLSVCGEDRPTMKEVAEALERFRKFEQHPWVLKHNPEEIESLLGGPSNDNPIRDSTGFYTMERRSVLNTEDGR